MKATVSDDGRITIPKALRARLGIRPGETLEFEAEGGRLVMTKPVIRDPFDAAFGILDLREGTDAAMEDARGPVHPSQRRPPSAT